MTIFRVAKLPVASFRGVEFAYQESSVDGGRKTISHEYTNRKERYVEDLGGIEKKFSITAWTDNNVSFSDRDALIGALEAQGIGTLIHPTLGTHQVACIGYNLTDSTKELGISKFTISFEVASLNINPSTLKGNKGFLANLKSKILGNSEAAFDSGWKSVTKAKAKFDSAVKTTKNAANEINRVSKLVQGAGDTFSDLTTSINQIVASANSLVQSPSVLASKMRTAFDNLSVAYNSSKDVFDVVKNLFGSDSSDRQATGNSDREKDIKANQDQINNMMNACAIAVAYNAAGNIDYQTLDELNQVNSELEAGFAALPTTIDRETKRLISEIRIEASNIFSRLAISLPNVANYEQFNPISLNTLIYSLHGSLDLKDTILALNSFHDTSRISGTIKILTNV